MGYYFYDLNAKVNHTFSDKDRLYLSVYGGLDKFFLEERERNQIINDVTESRLGWGNQTAALRWNHVFSPKLFLNTTATYSKYALDTRNYFGTDYGSEGIEDISLEYISGIDDIALKFDFDYVPSPEHFIRFGLSGIYHDFEPGQFDLAQNIPSDNYQFRATIGQDDISATELAAYVEDDYKVNDHLKVNAGLHLSAFAVEGSLYASLQPRVSARYLLSDDLSVKGSFATMRQYFQLLAFEGIGLPTDLWLPTTDRIRPQDSWQVVVGAAQNTGEGYEVSAEAYCKEMTNLIAYKDGSGLFEFGDWQDRVTQGDGNSYGLELFVQKKRGRFTGWVGYTLSWTYRQFDELNSGEQFAYRYDRRHDISVVSSFTVQRDNTLSFSWVYGTGNAITLPTSQVAVQYPNTRGVWTTTTDLYDDRKNPFFIYSDFDSERQPDGTFEEAYVLKQASLFPLIPSITYSVTF